VVVSDYTVENVGGVPRSFEIKLSAEKQPFSGLDKYVSVTVISAEIVGGSAVSFTETSDHLADNTIVRRTWRTDEVPAREKLRILTQSVMVKFLSDYEIWRTVYPTSDVSITVQYPECVDKFDARALHRLPLRPREIGPRTYRYELKSAALPHQGVVIWWWSGAGNSDLRFPPTDVERVMPVSSGENLMGTAGKAQVS
jgi:hypothetical protein